jgi:hypothetical protein
MTTLAEGVQGGAGALKAKFFGALDNIGSGISGWWDGLFAGDTPKIAPDLSPVPVPEEDSAQARGKGAGGALAGNTYNTFHIALSLPNVRDAKDFARDLNNALTEYGGGFAPA